VFVGVWLTGWTAGGVAAVLNHDWQKGLGLTAFGWAAIAAMLWLSLVVERRRIRRAADALLGHFDVRAQN
jgi:membrane protein DedA with SNARE-associated domain